MDTMQNFVLDPNQKLVTSEQKAILEQQLKNLDVLEKQLIAAKAAGLEPDFDMTTINAQRTQIKNLLKLA